MELRFPATRAARTVSRLNPKLWSSTSRLAASRSTPSFLPVPCATLTRRGRGDPHHEFGGVLEGHKTRTTSRQPPVDCGCSAFSERALRCMCWHPVGHLYLFSLRVNAFRYIDCHIPNRTQPGHCTRATHHRGMQAGNACVAVLVTFRSAPRSGLEVGFSYTSSAPESD